MKLEYKLGNVHCAGCASALEEILNKTDGVKSASLNFINNMLILDIENKDHKAIEERVIAAIKKFDKHIQILDPHAEEKAEKKKKLMFTFDIINICFSFASILILGLFNFDEILEFALYLFAYIVIGWKVLLTAAKNILQGKVLDENFLMMIATIGAFILSQYAEGVAVMLFYSVGEMFNNIAIKRSEKAIKSLASVKSDYANLILDNTEMKVTLDKVGIGDVIRVKAGEKVPLDGKIIEGETYVNTSAITGESQERFLRTDDEILSGFIVTNSTILVEVTKLEHESTVSKIIDLVEKSSHNKSKTEKFISKFAKYYTPVVVGLALTIGLIVPAFWGYSTFSTWIYRGLMFLVVSCPCALVISVPLSFFAGIGAAAKRGILIKGANYLEALAIADTIIFDKTGTLTKGEFKISKIHAEEDKTEEEILEFVAYAENFSNHQIAKSIVKEYHKKTGKEINFAWINGASEIAGEGVQANIFGIDCLVGNAKLMRDNNIEFNDVDSPFTIIYLAQNQTLAGYIEIQDEIKCEAKQAIDSLKTIGIKEVSMFTGDNEKVAGAVASKIGVTCYHADLLPINKVEELEKYKKNGSKLIFVGDGINDAPILSTVDVGIAMGGVGSDIAIESADVVLIYDDLSKIAIAKKIAKKTRRIVLENIIIAIGIKVVVMILSTIGLSNMWLAIFADVGVSVLAVLNSLRAFIVPKNKSQSKDKY